MNPRRLTRLSRPVLWTAVRTGLAGLVFLLAFGGSAAADETCQSPFLPKVTGQEDYIYVWTLGVTGVGDGNDSLVTIDANPRSAAYGTVIHRAPVPGRHEAHHAGFTDNRRYLWAGGLDTSQIFVFDVGPDPARPKLIKTIKTFPRDTGLVGPHTFYALPGRMLISALSNAKDGSGHTGLAEYANDGRYIRTIWLPKEAPYGYDVRVNVNLNRMLTSSFTGKKNYMRPLGDLVKDAEAMKQFGSTLVVWDFHARKPLQVLEVPGVPLEIRWALQPNHNYAFTSTALTAQLVLVHQKEDGTFAAKNIADIGKDTLPVDISIAPDDSKVYVNTYGDGTLRVYDVTNPFEGKVVEQIKLGEQANMVSTSWDGKRIYATSSLLSRWDKPDATHWLKAFAWEGDKLVPKFTVDFTSYELPPIKPVPSFTLLDERGRRVSTAALTRGRPAVVSFIYTSCADRLGCPVASMALREVQERLGDAGLAERAMFLSISFDPARDRPARLARYAQALDADPARWRFLTARSEGEIRLVLNAYGQDREPVHDERGRFAGRYRHVLKVFLLDQDGWIRNIYSTGFLVPEVVANDIQTLLAAPPR
jgi:selenium-binding protein 1